MKTGDIFMIVYTDKYPITRRSNNRNNNSYLLQYIYLISIFLKIISILRRYNYNNMIYSFLLLVLNIINIIY